MAQEKPYGDVGAGDEDKTQGLEGETVLDYLWSEESAEHAPVKEQAPPVPPAETASERELQEALARFASWLDAWSDQP